MRIRDLRRAIDGLDDSAEVITLERCHGPVGPGIVADITGFHPERKGDNGLNRDRLVVLVDLHDESDDEESCQ